MIQTIDILKSLIKSLSIDGVLNILGKSESISPPAFLYNVSFFKANRHSNFTQKTKMAIDVVYLSTKEDSERLEENLIIQRKMREFLDMYMLNVSDKVLHFDYEFKSFDGILRAYIYFDFLDNVKINDDIYELMEKINLKETI